MELAARVDVNVGSGQPVPLWRTSGRACAWPQRLHASRLGQLQSRAADHATTGSIRPHITYGVVTAGYAGRTMQLEASAFRGAEPDEQRWNIETPKLDQLVGPRDPDPFAALGAAGQLW